MFKRKLQKNEKKDLSSSNLKDIEYLDCNSLISSYDFSAINASLYDYAVNSEKWCRSLCDIIVYFEKNNKLIIKEIDKCSKFFICAYEINPILTDEENAIFKKGYDLIRNYLLIDLESKKELLKNNAAEFKLLQDRIIDATLCENNIIELGRIETEPHPSFALFTQMTLASINSSYLKINTFISKKEQISYISDSFVSMYNTYQNEMTSGRNELIRSYEESRIPHDTAISWADDLRKNMLVQLKAFISIIEYYLRPSSSGFGSQAVKEITESNTVLAYEELVDVIIDYNNKIRDFYINKRKDIYIRNAVNNSISNFEMLDKLNTESNIYELSGNLRKRICDTLRRVSEKDAKFIIESFGELCNIPLIDLSQLEEGRLKKQISSETYKKIDELKKSIYEKMQKDAEGCKVICFRT